MDTHNELVSGNIKSLIPSYTVPISVNKTTLGLPLVTHLDDMGNICRIDYPNKNGVINFLDTILDKGKFLRAGHPDKFVYFDKSFKFSLVSINNTEFVLAYSHVSDKTYKKIRFSSNGVVLVINSWYIIKKSIEVLTYWVEAITIAWKSNDNIVFSTQKPCGTVRFLNTGKRMLLKKEIKYFIILLLCLFYLLYSIFLIKITRIFLR